MTEQCYCIKSNFARNWMTARWKPFRRLRWLSVMMLWASNRLWNGKTSLKMVDSEPCFDRPLASRNDQVIVKVKAVVMWDRCVTIWKIEEEVNISTFSAHAIWTEDLTMKRVLAKLIPKLLTFLAKNQTPVVCQAPYSLDMAPCNFWLFPKLKRKGKGFQTREDIMTATVELNTIQKEAFLECFQQWQALLFSPESWIIF